MKDSFYDLYCLEVEKNEKLSKELSQVKSYNKYLVNRVRYLETHSQQIIEKEVEQQIKQVTKSFEDKIVSLSNQVDRLRSVLNNDSSNSSIPTSQTPLNQKKRIPNSREKSNQPKGAQVNHPKHSLHKFKEDEVTERITHKINRCPDCGGECRELNSVCKDETDFEIIVKKIRHEFVETQCIQCGKKYKEAIPTRLKEENQYGNGVKALALSLMNEGYVSMNRTKEILCGLTNDEIDPSVGYISKLQKQCYESLKIFNNELKKEIIQSKVVHWDDTVIMIDTKRGCLRFYGDEKLAYYKAHEKKNKAGLDEDEILGSLDEKTYVVHDHNKINYNEEYVFQNVECCVHLLRELKKVVDNLGHEWPKDMIELLLSENDKRNKGHYVDPEYVSIVYDQYVAKGEMENTADEDKYYAHEERGLLKRLKEYKENYLLWTMNKEIPFSNNISERGLRSSKTKMKVSGQFSNIAHAEYFAGIKSYIETGHRHGMNSILLIKRALDGKPVSISEMKKHDEEFNRFL